jgi:hypothetical protein
MNIDYVRPALGLLQGIIIYALVRSNLDLAVGLCAAIVLTFPLFCLQVKLLTRATFALGMSMLAVMAILYGIAGYHLASGFLKSATYIPLILAPQCILSAFIFFIFYCVAVEEGKLSFPYTSLFSESWQVVLKLILGNILVYWTWGLCWLAAGLFQLLGISLVYELVTSQAFHYIMPAFFFGISMTILYRYETIITKLRDIVLAFSKFLYPILVVISLCFLVAVPFANKAFSEFWMIIVLISALNIILFNGIYQAGVEQRPYPEWFCYCIYATFILLGVYSVYILKFPYAQIRDFGLKPAVFYALIALIFLCFYCIGYVAAIFSKKPWLSLIKPVNTYIAMGIVLVYLLLALPGLNIDSLSAKLQGQRLLNNQPIVDTSQPAQWPAYLAGVNLQGANLQGKDLRNINFTNAHLKNANLSGANLEGSQLQQTDLTGANLSNANLKFARLTNVDLSNSNLSSANLFGASFSSVNLTKTNLSNSDISESYGLTQEDLDKACGQNVKLREQLTIKPCQ